MAMPSSSSLTPKQLQRLRNKLNNEKQQLEKQLKKQSYQPPAASGLSKGQRRRLNARKGGQASAPQPAARQRYSNLYPGPDNAVFSGGQSQRVWPMSGDELIANINGSVAFATTGFHVNPGLAGTFPWCAPIAGQFEKYTVDMLEFYYAPLVSAFAPEGQAGKVMLSFDYNAADPAPTSKIQVEDTFPHADGLPCQNICLRISPSECNTQDSKYIRRGPVGAGDIKTFDAGVIYISTEGNTNATAAGELRVRYSFRLRVPVLETTPVAPPNFHTAVYQLVAPTNLSGSPTPVPLVQLYNPLGITNSTPSQLVLPAGNYVISVMGEFHDTVGISSANLYLSYDLTTGFFQANGGATTDTYISGSFTNFLPTAGQTISLDAICTGAGVSSIIGTTIVIQSV